MIKCDEEGCNWEGTQLGLHKSRAHSMHGTLRGISFGHGIEKDFHSLTEVIEKLGSSLSLDQIRQLNDLLAQITEDKHTETLRKRAEEDALFEKMRARINGRNGLR